MFVRRKKNISGIISVQVIDKSGGKYRVAKTIGSSADEAVLRTLVAEAEFWMRQQSGLKEFDFAGSDLQLERLLGSIQQISIAGIELILGKLFTEIGFAAIEDELFKKLVLARLCYPASKLKTVDYLRRYEQFDTNEAAIYRYMDKLNKTQKRSVQCISYKHTLSILSQRIQVVFYDVTTLYFDIEQEDELRKPGFSKDGKHQNPQIVLGLLVSEGGYPLAYEIYEGNKFEGDTMLPVLNLFRRKYKLSHLVVVADAGLLSQRNIEALEQNGYQYILGARIKNESRSVQAQIMALELMDGESAVLQKSEKLKLIISYSAARARKDNHNRERGLKKLQKQIKAGRLTKGQLTSRGYNKFLTLQGEVNLAIDQSRIKADTKWDGLKGYLTNTTLSKEAVIENYGHLWRIEKAFRVAKTDIKVRPVFHYARRRIEAHICIAFVAYKIYKELERQLHEKKAVFSPANAIEIAKTIYSIKAIKPSSGELFEKTLLLNDEQRTLFQLFYP